MDHLHTFSPTVIKHWRHIKLIYSDIFWGFLVTHVKHNNIMHSSNQPYWASWVVVVFSKGEVRVRQDTKSAVASGHERSCSLQHISKYCELSPYCKGAIPSITWTQTKRTCQHASSHVSRTTDGLGEHTRATHTGSKQREKEVACI